MNTDRNDPFSFSVILSAAKDPVTAGLASGDGWIIRCAQNDGHGESLLHPR
jgi:hypothetical protein